jgi:peptide methionine sulfoxide reductase msrA/msrB
MNKLFSTVIITTGILILVMSACGQSSVKSKQADIKLSEYPVSQTEQYWKSLLTDEQYAVLRNKGTERPFSGKLLHNKEKGVYTCVGCGNTLFTDEMKFDSHCGWPSFDREISGGKIKQVEDRSHGMVRTEIVCANCGGHLGHLFDDGPTSTGLRYCVNSTSLNFLEASKSATMDTITLGGGCYWCVEAVYEKLEGVEHVVSGFSGGYVANPTYQEVSLEKTGHAEVVQIVFKPQKTNVEEILQVFFTVHDPTTYNRQGADVGEQYRSVIFYHNDKQRQAARNIIDELNKQGVYENPVVTELKPFKAFYAADEEHQDYYKKNTNKPYCKMVIQPKMEKFEKIFKDRLKKQ